MTVFGKITKDLLDLVYPPQCLACKAPLDHTKEAYLCKRCVGDIKTNPKPWCVKCGRAVGGVGALCHECRKTRYHFERAYSACLYEGPLKECVHQFKYRGRSQLSRLLSGFIIDFIKDNAEILEGVNAVTAVPLSAKRLKEREYNQSRLLAAEISETFALPLLDALIKTRSTPPQSEMRRESRLTNIKDAFGMREGVNLNGRNVLLVDDVLTTGSTLNECARVLAEAGAKKVIALTLARGT